MLPVFSSLALSLLVLLGLLAPCATACSLPTEGVWGLNTGSYNTTVDTSAACQAAAAWTPGNGTECCTTTNITVCQQAYNGTSGIVAGVTSTGLAACCPYDSWCQTCGSPCVGFTSYVCNDYTPEGECVVDTCLVAPAYIYEKRSTGCPFSVTTWYSLSKVTIADYFGSCSSSTGSSSPSTGASGGVSTGTSATRGVSSSFTGGVSSWDNGASLPSVWNPLFVIVLLAVVVFPSL